MTVRPECGHVGVTDKGYCASCDAIVTLIDCTPMAVSKSTIRSFYREHLALLPAHMHDDMANYIEHGREIGGFMTALFEGDFERAKVVADFRNAARWENWMDFLKEFMPAAAHGSPLKVQAWRKMGGLDGYPDGAP